MTKRNLAIGLSFFIAFGVLVYWTLVFTKIFPVVDLIPGYSDWFVAFSLADLWIAATAFWLATSCSGDVNWPYRLALRPDRG